MTERQRSLAILGIACAITLIILVTVVFVFRAEPQTEPQPAAPETQTAPIPVPTPTPDPAILTEVERLKLVNAYQRALLAQTDVQRAQQKMNELAQQYNTMVVKLKSEHHWPEATRFEVNAETEAVSVVLPSPPDKKPEQSSPK